MANNRELIDAAKMLMEHCENTACIDCVFGDGSCTCPLSDGDPEDWKLPEEGEADE